MTEIKKNVVESYKYTVRQLESKYETDSDSGLSESVVNIRKQEYGLNTINSGKEISPWEIFINQFKNLLIYILIFATLLSFYI